MKKTIFAGLLLMAAAQSANAQKVVLHMAGNQKFECNVSQLDSITFEDDGFIVIDEHEWVDLGLPSGTLWATCNVGANSPEEYGDYFAWGETEPKYNYNYWSNYTYCNDTNKMTKYCTDSFWGYDGFTDTLTELLPEDDAATVNWGSSWQMPSVEQFQELINNSYTTTKWTTQNGKNGRLITSKSNNNSIFLPAAGSRVETRTDDGYGCYWSRSLNTLSCTHAYYLYFSSGDYIRLDITQRFIGHTVRPVRIKTR